MNPNSRSPCADWFRFMKSMSMELHGRSRLNCVCRWANGFCSDVSPRIHIFAGEKVCIQAMSPMQFGVPVCFPAHLGDRVGCCEHGLVNDPDREGGGVGQPCRDSSGVLSHSCERLLAIEVLAAGEKPHFEVSEIDHDSQCRAT